MLSKPVYILLRSSSGNLLKLHSVALVHYIGLETGSFHKQRKKYGGKMLIWRMKSMTTRSLTSSFSFGDFHNDGSLLVAAEEE